MKTTPETKAKALVQRAIAMFFSIRGVSYSYRTTAASQGIGGNGRPDALLMFEGHCVEIEVKAGDNTLSALQRGWLKTTAQTRNYAWTIWGDRDVELAWLIEQLGALLDHHETPHLKITRVKSNY